MRKIKIVVEAEVEGDPALLEEVIRATPPSLTLAGKVSCRVTGVVEVQDPEREWEPLGPQMFFWGMG